MLIPLRSIVQHTTPQNLPPVLLWRSKDSILMTINYYIGISIKDTLNKGHLSVKETCPHSTVILYCIINL